MCTPHWFPLLFCCVCVRVRVCVCVCVRCVHVFAVHVWNYRRLIAESAYTRLPGKVTPTTEFAFTTEHINKNFSNASAWHYRSVLIPRLFSPALPTAPTPPTAATTATAHAQGGGGGEGEVKTTASSASTTTTTTSPSMASFEEYRALIDKGRNMCVCVYTGAH